jgi:hypothetical protein
MRASKRDLRPFFRRHTILCRIVAACFLLGVVPYYIWQTLKDDWQDIVRCHRELFAMAFKPWRG